MALFKRLAFELLESRRLLAKDLEIIAIDFTNAVGELTGTTPTVGEKVYVRVHWQTTDLTAADSYKIRWEMDGVETEPFDYVGSPGVDVDNYWYHGGWIAQAGASHSLTVTVDSGGSVVEANESNNAITLSPFTPLPATSLPAKFGAPIAGAQNVDWVLGGYVDVNPKFYSDDQVKFFKDYQGNTTTTRDSHNGLDYAIANFAAQDAGVQVLAAAAGTVIEINDGEFDRETQLTFSNPGNYVFIDHGNGWVTQYWHLQRDSIAVAVNDVVVAGQVLGLVGSSGNSAGPHLHFEIQHNKTPVDPFAAPGDFFVSPPPYVIDPVLPNNLLDFGVTNDIYDGTHTFLGPSFAQVQEQVSDIGTFPTSGEEVYAWAVFTSVEAGDTWRALLYRPNGTLVNDYSSVMFTQPTDFQDDGDTDAFDFLAWQRGFGTTSGAQKADGDANYSGGVDEVDLAHWELQFGQTAINGWEWGWYRPGYTESTPGTWRVDFLYNNVKVGEQSFEVGAALPEIRVFDDTHSIYLIDDRATPIDFGAAVQGQTGPTTTFKVENHGYGSLTISGVSLPTGFSVVESLDATIAAGASDTFTVRLDSAVLGSKAGQVVVSSNDASESTFAFAIEGVVNPSSPAASSELQGVAVEYALRFAPAVSARSDEQQFIDEDASAVLPLVDQETLDALALDRVDASPNVESRLTSQAVRQQSILQHEASREIDFADDWGVAKPLL